MKGIPTVSLNRLKRAAAVAGVGALVVGGALLGTTQAHAAVTPNLFGTGTGLTITPATGSGTATENYSSVPCPTGFQGSAVIEAIDPTTPAGTSKANTNVDLLAGNTSVAVTFTGTFTPSSLTNEEANLGVADGQQFEVGVYCFTAANETGPGEWASGTFATLSNGGTTYTADQTLSGPPQSVNITLTASPNPATAGQSVTLTATASVSGATGTVQFENNGTNINGPATISGGTATTSTTFAAAATENLTAVYTPTGSFTAGSAGALSLVVNPAPANSGTIPLAVSVPQSGSFSLTVDTTDVVTLTATGLTAAGVTTPITVADSRNSYPGWSVSGQDSAWTGTGTAAGGTFTGDQLGWVPTDTALAPAVTLGSPVTAAAPGLGTTAATLASVHAGLGNGYGTSTLGANLSLVIPATAPAGPYTSGLTISAVTSNP
jgi:hypothetical protein